MSRQSVLVSIKQLGRPVWTTREIAVLSSSSLSNVTQGLNFLARQGLIFKVYRGVWAEAGNESLTPYSVIPLLFPRHRAYVSFISALHLHGIIEQIPQIITLASTVHTKTIHTKVGIFSIHQIAPSFFDGFNWYRGSGDFLIAEPEKALIDALYLSARKKKQFRYFPELHFSKSFSTNRAKHWVSKIPGSKIRSCVKARLNALLEQQLPQIQSR